MIFAILDLGTNTFNLLIARRINDEQFEKIETIKIPVKLGDTTINQSYISEIPFNRGIDALKQYKEIISKYKIEKIFAFATSAIRSAKNGKDFVRRVRQETGIKINVIDGCEEAELIYHGSKMAVEMGSDISLIMDIGGGSTEFILANNNTIFWKHSFLLGAARLLDLFKPSDKITETELLNINNHLKTELKPLWDAAKIFSPIQLIGAAGAFDSVVDMIACQFNTLPINDYNTEYIVNLSYYNAISEKVKTSSLLERQQINGLIEMRADMMVISVLLIDIIFSELPIPQFKTSAFSLKEGVILKHLGLKF